MMCQHDDDAVSREENTSVVTEGVSSTHRVITLGAGCLGGGVEVGPSWSLPTRVRLLARRLRVCSWSPVLVKTAGGSTSPFVCFAASTGLSEYDVGVHCGHPNHPHGAS